MLKQLLYRFKRLYHFFKTGLGQGFLTELKLGFPARKLKIITITGTDGKTTSSTLLYHVLHNAEKKVALLSTVAAYVGDEEIDTGLHVTSPNPATLHKLLKMMVDKGMEYVVLEYTSHGAYQHRMWGITPTIAGLTNINNEHLDYHLNYQNYLEAKALILKKAAAVILNKDDQSYLKLRKILDYQRQHLLAYSEEDTLPKLLEEAVQKRFPEHFNQLNSRLVIKIAQLLEVNEKAIAKGIANFPGVPGRMQFIPLKKPYEVVVDFAHTPQGLEAALMALRQKMNTEKREGKLIAVFGCAGLRDRGKRPVMGKIAVSLADQVVMTAEDPRTEDIWSIIRQMKEQLTEGHDKVISIADRKEAIDFALNRLAKKGDIIGIFGKGPEKSMCYGTVEYPWSDVSVVKELATK